MRGGGDMAAVNGGAVAAIADVGGVFPSHHQIHQVKKSIVCS